MADLSTMFPQVDVNQLGPVAGMMLGDQFNVAKQNAGMNQQRAQQDLSFNEDMNPLKMATERAQAGLMGSQAKHADALTSNSVFDLEQKERLKEPTYKKAITDLQAGTQEAEVKGAHAHLEQQLMSPDPKIREQAQHMYKVTGDMLKMYAEEAEKRTTAFGVADRHAAATRDAATARAKGAGGGAKPPTTMQGQYAAYLRQAETAETPEEQQYYSQLADQVFKNMLELGNARAPVYDVSSPNLPKNPQGPGARTPVAIPPKPGASAAPAAAPAPAPQQYETGKSYTGKSGTYRYKGGDPKDKANWEKI